MVIITGFVAPAEFVIIGFVFVIKGVLAGAEKAGRCWKGFVVINGFEFVVIKGFVGVAGGAPPAIIVRKGFSPGVGVVGLVEVGDVGAGVEVGGGEAGVEGGTDPDCVIIVVKGLTVFVGGGDEVTRGDGVAGAGVPGGGGVGRPGGARGPERFPRGEAGPEEKGGTWG